MFSIGSRVNSVESKNSAQMNHDFNAHLSTLNLAMKMIQEEWEKNPDSVSTVIELSIEKLQHLKTLISKEQSKQ